VVQLLWDPPILFNYKQAWYRRCALAFQAREDRSVAGCLLQLNLST